MQRDMATFEKQEDIFKKYTKDVFKRIEVFIKEKHSIVDIIEEIKNFDALVKGIFKEGAKSKTYNAYIKK